MKRRVTWNRGAIALVGAAIAAGAATRLVIGHNARGVAWLTVSLIVTGVFIGVAGYALDRRNR